MSIEPDRSKKIIVETIEPRQRNLKEALDDVDELPWEKKEK